ncbi:MAG: hypothetical protein H0W90_09635 [Actinobacteria bacterium]|nr:hypothetical protein [Actinomycetota bacterium]
MASRDLEPTATLHSRRLRRAGRSPSARALILCAAAVATAFVTAAAAQSKPLRRLESPQLDQIARAFRPITDKQVALSAVPNGFWGGQYRTTTGESVTVYASNSYPVDPALGQRWADFLATLVHGSELATVTVLIATPTQIARTCGSGAVACYSAQGSFLYTPGEDPGSDLSAEAVITHEYGHHVAANRSNAPWLALDYGPKRWASAMQVCAKAKTGVLVPGAEDPVQYTENPGEGWAETYRVLNERNAGRAETPWDIVSDAMYPTTAALAAAVRDVTNPWMQATVTTQAAAFTRTTRRRTFTIATQLDGALKVTLRPSAGLRLGLGLFAGAKRVSRAVSATIVSRGTAVCGVRSYKVRVNALSGRGSVQLTVSKP